jgi:glucosamine--fructose-6-phosphate aminotransferase (isomerizing)
MAREADAALMTLAGPEIGVASTKAFTMQLAVLACFTLALGRAREPHCPRVMREEPSATAATKR